MCFQCKQKDTGRTAEFEDLSLSFWQRRDLAVTDLASAQHTVQAPVNF